MYVHNIGMGDSCGDKEGFAFMMTYRPLMEQECTYMKHHKNFQDDESISWHQMAKNDQDYQVTTGTFADPEIRFADSNLLLSYVDADGLHRVFSYEEAIRNTANIGNKQVYWVVDTLNRDHSFVVRIQDAPG